MDFSEPELVNILFSAANALSYLQNTGVTHGNISSSSILLTNNDNDIKLGDPQILNFMTSYQVMMSQGPKKGLYLSPKLLLAFREKNWTPQHNPFKSDIFVLGLVILETVNMKYCDEVYNYDSYYLN